MRCDMLILDAANGGGFDYDGYNYGVGIGDEDGGFVWGGLVCVCEICVGDVPDLSKVMVCGAVAESVIIVSIYDSFVLGGIVGVWYGTWLERRLYFLGFYYGRIGCNVFGTFLSLRGDG